MHVLKADILRTYDMIRPNHSALGAWIECFRSPGVQAVIAFRFSQWLSRQNALLRALLTPLRVLLYDAVRMMWGIQIGRTARIGEGLYIGHFGNIIVGRTVVMGRNCNVSQGVTIGLAGQGEKRGAPVIGDHVYLAPGAKVYGKIRIGNNVTIGANAVVYKDIPDNAVVVSSPGFKILTYNAPPAVSQEDLARELAEMDVPRDV